MVSRLGEQVLYKLTGEDVGKIQAQRHDSPKWGNEPRVGDLAVGVVVKDWGKAVNLHLFLDGNDGLWVTSVCEAPVQEQWVPGQWTVLW